MALQSLAQQTRARVAVLQSYFSESIGSERNKLCSNYRECHSSFCAQKLPDGNFHYGQLPHIGFHYDLLRSGRPFRIAVVGAEIGAEQSWGNTLKVIRDSGVRWGAKETEYSERESHMKGTTSILRLLFGKKPSLDHEGEFVAVEGKPVHLFDCYALVNLLRCSAVKGKKKTGLSTAAMRKNCAFHFRQVIGVLAPTVLVLQGHALANWFHENGLLANPIEADGYHGVIEVAGVKSHLLAFTHPSTPNGTYGWGATPSDPYLLNTVKPAVERFISTLN